MTGRNIQTLRWLIFVVLFTALSSAAWSPAQARLGNDHDAANQAPALPSAWPQCGPIATGDSVADRVLGQADCGHNTVGSGLGNLNRPQGVAVDRSSGRLYVADRANGRVLSWLNAATFNNGDAADISITSDGTSGLTLAPQAVAVDSNHNLYVADFTNSRVLKYSAPVTNTIPASLVIGQPDLLSNGSGTTDHNFNGPFGIALDSDGNLYVADQNNNRVLQFLAPLSTNKSANRVVGQPDFTSGTPNNGGVTPNSLYAPQGVALDNTGNLYAADTQNHRILKYNTPLANGMAASLVLGQLNFTSNTANQSGGATPTAQTLNWPAGIAIDTLGRLFVADVNNNRVLGYNPPSSNGMAARWVFGQPDFVNSAFNPNGPPSADSLWQPYGVAVDSAQNIYIADYFNNRVLGYNTPFLAKLFLPLVSR